MAKRSIKTAFVPRGILERRYLGVIPACAVALAACSSSDGGGNRDIALAYQAFDSNVDGDADTRGNPDAIVLADIGFRPDTHDADDGASDAGDADTSDGPIGVADVGFGG